MISRWDEAETDKVGLGYLGVAWTDLGNATGSKRIGVSGINE